MEFWKIRDKFNAALVVSYKDGADIEALKEKLNEYGRLEDDERVIVSIAFRHIRANCKTAEQMKQMGSYGIMLSTREEAERLEIDYKQSTEGPLTYITKIDVMNF